MGADIKDLNRLLNSANSTCRHQSSLKKEVFKNETGFAGFSIADLMTNG
jgi:hypothetical protein